MHKNSQKQKYCNSSIYFITTNTRNSFPYFREDIFAEQLVNDIYYCKEIKKFNLFGYKVNYDHIHLLIEPLGIENHSKILQNIKRVSSLHINQKSGLDNEGGNIYSGLQWTKELLLYQDNFIAKSGVLNTFPKFRWQESFHDHIIRNENDFRKHITYIENQWIKHNYDENKFCFIDYELCNKYLFGFLGLFVENMH